MRFILVDTSILFIFAAVYSSFVRILAVPVPTRNLAFPDPARGPGSTGPHPTLLMGGLSLAAGAGSNAGGARRGLGFNSSQSRPRPCPRGASGYALQLPFSSGRVALRHTPFSIPQRSPDMKLHLLSHNSYWLDSHLSLASPEADTESELGHKAFMRNEYLQKGGREARIEQRDKQNCYADLTKPQSTHKELRNE